MSSLGQSPATAATPDMNPLLLDAKNIYVNQLSEAVGPYILKTIEHMHAQTLEAGSSRVLLRFQRQLREVPLWNSALVAQHAATIEVKHPYLSDLIAAAFVAYVKVMSSIKLRPDKPNIRLKLPTNAAFVHKAFVNVARDFYAAPQLGANPSDYAGMRAAVELSIRQMLPIREILKAYLGNTVDDAHTVSPTLNDDDDARPADSPADSPSMFVPEPEPELDEPVHQPEPHPAPVPAPQAEAPQAEVKVTECETKTISIPHLPPAKDDDLFSDADDEETDWKRGPGA